MLQGISLTSLCKSVKTNIMKRKIWFTTGFLLLIMGCDNIYMICSLNPYYVEKNIILNPAIEGLWFARPVKSVKDSANSGKPEIWARADTTSTWSIKRYIYKQAVKTKGGQDSTIDKPENYYIARLIRPLDSVIYEFKVVLFNVNKGLYADFIPYAKENLMNSKLASNSFFEMHTLARLTIIQNRAAFSWLGADCMKEMIQKKRVRVNYKWVMDTGRFLLTASSHDLTEMIERYADQPRFIDWDAQYARLNLTRLN
jgi:hypothetical protein